MFISVQEQDFSIETEIKNLTKGLKNVGAVVSFTGLVRGDDGIEAMTLEHYPAMSEKQLRAIADEAKNRFALEDCLIIHRFGKLKVGEQIVLVITLSKSREAAFNGASFLMDWLKTKAPFWKKEHSATESRWVEAKKSDIEKQKNWL